MKRVFFAGLLGGLVVFAGGAVSWMALPWHTASLHSLADDSVARDMATRGMLSGVYCYPGLPPAGASEAQKAEVIAKHKVGPRITMMVFRRDGQDCMDPTKYIAGLGINVAAAWLVAAMLGAAAGSLPRYGQRVLFVAGLGIFAALVAHGEAWLWWSYPNDFGLLNVIDVAVGWIAGGLAIAAIIRPLERRILGRA